MKPTARVSSIPPYFFATLGKRIQELRKSGVDVIRMDMGSPDLPPAPHIVEALVQAAHRPDAHGYTPYGGTVEFREAAADFYDRRFGVQADPKSEVIALIGSKEGLFNITQAFVSSGDVVLVPSPGYPTYSAAALLAGAQVEWMPLLEDKSYLPDFDSLPLEVLSRTKIMWLNYPNNPTAATAELELFARAVQLAGQYDFLLCHDAPYTETTFEGYRPPSLLQVEGAMQVAVEFNSLSKAYNMAGWRLGMALGNAQAIQALYTLKSQIDSSQFGPTLEGGVAALRGDQSWLEERNAIYQERRDIVLEAFRDAGMTARRPLASLYVWAKVPEGRRSDAEFCESLLEDAGVSITPGVAFGPEGEGYVRVSLATATKRVHQAMEKCVEWIRRN